MASSIKFEAVNNRNKQELRVLGGNLSFVCDENNSPVAFDLDSSATDAQIGNQACCSDSRTNHECMLATAHVSVLWESD